MYLHSLLTTCACIVLAPLHADEQAPISEYAVLATRHTPQSPCLQVTAFRKLSVRPRRQILTDGLARPLDWGAAGREVWCSRVVYVETYAVVCSGLGGRGEGGVVQSSSVCRNVRSSM